MPSVDGDHKGHIKGTGSLYQGLHIEAGEHTLFIDTDLTSGAGNIFVRDAISGAKLASLTVAKGNVLQNSVSFVVAEPGDLELGVELLVQGEILIDNAFVDEKE